MKRRNFLAACSAGLAGARRPGAAAGNAQQKRFRVTDTHVHVFNSTIQGSNGIPKYYPDSTVEHQIELMNRGGVDKAFLISYNAEDVAAEIRKRGESPVLVAPVANKRYQYNSWREHKDRFWWFPDHVRPLREGYVEELDRDLTQGGSGVKLLPLFHGLLPDHPGWMPVYELCRKRRKPIILDLSWWYFGRYPFDNESAARQKFAASFTNYGDYAKLLSPIFEQFSSVPFSLAHCGTAKSKEDYPYIFDLISRHKNLSCDVGMVNGWGPEFFEQLVKAVGPRKIMYGTDAPYWFKGPDSYRTGRFRWTFIADECPFLNDEGKQLILAGNAERFVKNELP